MSQVTDNTLKGYFATNRVPVEGQYENLIDSRHPRLFEGENVILTDEGDGQVLVESNFGEEYFLAPFDYVISTTAEFRNIPASARSIYVSAGIYTFVPATDSGGVDFKNAEYVEFHPNAFLSVDHQCFSNSVVPCLFKHNNCTFRRLNGSFYLFSSLSPGYIGSCCIFSTNDGGKFLGCRFTTTMGLTTGSGTESDLPTGSAVSLFGMPTNEAYVSGRTLSFRDCEFLVYGLPTDVNSTIRTVRVLFHYPSVVDYGFELRVHNCFIRVMPFQTARYQACLSFYPFYLGNCRLEVLDSRITTGVGVGRVLFSSYSGQTMRSLLWENVYFEALSYPAPNPGQSLFSFDRNPSEFCVFSDSAFVNLNPSSSAAYLGSFNGDVSRVFWYNCYASLGYYGFAGTRNITRCRVSSYYNSYSAPNSLDDTYLAANTFVGGWNKMTTAESDTVSE